jgi:hypothetical protein
LKKAVLCITQNCPARVGSGSSTSSQAEAGHFRFSPKTRHLAAARRSAAKLLTRDEARRIAANIAKGAGAAAALTTNALYKPLGQLTQINAARRAHPKLGAASPT